MTMPSRLVFFGTEEFSAPTLTALIGAGYNIVAIVTKPDTTRGRGRKSFTHPIKQIGVEHNIPVLQPVKLNDIESELKNYQADAAVLVSYGKIISQRILNLFEPIGIINIHPSRLPKYRGPSPVEAAILAGDESTAVSIMKLDAGMDTGPVYVQKDVELSSQETKPELSEKLSHLGASLLIETLPGILSGQIQPKVQSNVDVSVTSLIAKQDGILDPTTDTANTLERKIRAYQGYPKPHLTLYGNDVIITSAKVVDSPSETSLVIPCADETWLRIDELIAPSGRRMTGMDFVNGLRGKRL